MKSAVQTQRTDTAETFGVVEAGIAQLRAALESGEVSSEELVRLYLERIEI